MLAMLAMWLYQILVFPETLGSYPFCRADDRLKFCLEVQLSPPERERLQTGKTGGGRTH